MLKNKVLKAGIGAVISFASLLPVSAMAWETYSVSPLLKCSGAPTYVTIGQSGKIDYEFPEADGIVMEGDVVFSSSDNDVLRMEADGTWEAVGTGEVTFEYNYEASDESVKAFEETHPGVTLTFRTIAQCPWTGYVYAHEDIVYRRYNPNSGEHFFTADQKEADYLTSIGWKDEGVAWTTAGFTGMPVFRLYNKNAGDHHYTMNPGERDALVKEGWIYEGISWYSVDDSHEPVYRAFNPNAKAGAHHYTQVTDEYTIITRMGWRKEGAAWYVFEKGE